MSPSNEAQPESRTVVLLRHGIAEERAADGSDESRALTVEGREKMQEIARGLAKLIPNVATIYSSPLVRAAQTAQIVAKAYGAKIVTSDALAGGGTPKDFRALFEGTADRAAIYVGHEPNLTEIFLALLGIRRPKGRIALKRGACYVVAMSAAGEASLDVVLTPRVLRRL